MALGGNRKPEDCPCVFIFESDGGDILNKSGK